MTNMALEVALEDLGVPFARANVGDRYVLELMRERGWVLGGEGSGHLLCLDKHSTGDGIISALQVLSTMRRHNKTLPEFFSNITMFPQTLINVRVAAGTDWKQNAKMVEDKAKVEAELGKNGRVLIRASGTEPLIRVMVEARQESTAQEMAKRLAAHLNS
jgi:phosphoglucosamine mutase